MDEVIGVKRKAKAPIVARDRVLSKEESESPWISNKNPTGWGDAKDVASNWGEHTKRRVAAKKVVVRALKQAAGDKLMTIDMEGNLKDHMLLPADVVNRLLPGITNRPLDQDEPVNWWGMEPTQQQQDDEEVVELALDQADGEEMVTVDEKVHMKDHVLLPVDVVKLVFPGIANRLLQKKASKLGPH